MVRILLLTARADYGGGPEHVWQLVNAFNQEFEVFVACPKDEPYFKRFVKTIGSSRIVEIPHRAFSLRATAAVRRFIIYNKINIVHSHGKGAGLYSRLLGLATSSVLVIHTFHGLHINHYARWKRWIYARYEWFASKITRTLVSVSEGERAHLIKAGVCNPDKLTVIPNGLLINEIRSQRFKNRVPAIAIAVMRFDFQKNPELLSTIIEMLANEHGQSVLRFEILGDGPGRQQFEARLDAHGLSDMCSVRGAVDDVRLRLSQADVFLSTSRWEGLPIAMLEAMAEGVPVVATDVVGNRDLVSHDVSGYLFDPNIPEDAVAYLRRATGTEGDRLCSNAHALVKSQFGIEQMINSVRKLYEMHADRYEKLD